MVDWILFGVSLSAPTGKGHKRTRNISLMPDGTDSADLIIPPLSTATSLDEVNSIMTPTTSVSALLELGEAAESTAQTQPSPSPQEAQNLPEVEAALIKAAQEDIARLLGIRDGSVALDGMVGVIEVNAGDVISKEMEIQTELYYIISGRLTIAQTSTVAGPVSAQRNYFFVPFSLHETNCFCKSAVCALLLAGQSDVRGACILPDQNNKNNATIFALRMRCG